MRLLTPQWTDAERWTAVSDGGYLGGRRGAVSGDSLKVDEKRLPIRLN
jgi:hypothetical protein